jgi:hypothetical protein
MPVRLAQSTAVARPGKAPAAHRLRRTRLEPVLLLRCQAVHTLHPLPAHRGRGGRGGRQQRPSDVGWASCQGGVHLGATPWGRAQRAQSGRGAAGIVPAAKDPAPDKHQSIDALAAPACLYGLLLTCLRHTAGPPAPRCARTPRCSAACSLSAGRSTGEAMGRQWRQWVCSQGGYNQHKADGCHG